MVVFSTFEVMGKERAKEKQNTTPPKFPCSRKMNSHKTIFEQFQITGFEISKTQFKFYEAQKCHYRQVWSSLIVSKLPGVN